MLGGEIKLLVSPPVDNTTDTTVLYNLLKPDIRVDDDDDDALVSKNEVVTKTKLRVRIMTPPPTFRGEEIHKNSFEYRRPQTYHHVYIIIFKNIDRNEFLFFF